ncbi:hypothetical protein V866_004817 [Kwoniella sp. B9012]|uniref:Uncharacterized protein n=1 Tax=Kwoniella europaea PYCC6329 TaxID=1423913 RepID=A0AAX4KL98_9TREE
MKNLSRLPAGTGPWSGSLPFHMWTEAQTCIVLDKIASNNAYFKSFILQSDTKWMEWMIRHDWIIRDGNGHPTAKDVWHKNHMAITTLFNSILQPSAEKIRSVLGPISSESEIRVGSRNHQIWTRLQESGKNTWYFNKRNDRVLSFNGPAGFDSDDEGTYRPSSSVVSRRPALVAKNKRKTQQDWPGRQVSDRIPWSGYIANVDEEKDIPPHLQQITSSTTTTPSSNLVEISSADSGSESVVVGDRDFGTVIED